MCLVVLFWLAIGSLVEGKSPSRYGLSYKTDLDFQGPAKYVKKDNSMKAKFFLFYGQDASVEFEFENAADLLKNLKFNDSLKTVVYIHGFTDGAVSESVETIVQAYLERGDHNIIILDWHTEAEPGYLLNALPNFNMVARKGTLGILRMLESGLSLEKLHLVGHSLGGEMVGMIARDLYKRTNGTFKLKRITALDPAFPGFYNFPVYQHVTKDDAEFVDIIHTDGGLLGTPYTTGTVDFWPNGGLSPQPGCELWVLQYDICSHIRSWAFWAESVAGKYKKEFNAIKANSWVDFQRDYVEKFDPTIRMGIDCPNDIKGNYYLQTNAFPPYAKGEKGVKYEKFS